MFNTRMCYYSMEVSMIPSLSQGLLKVHTFPPLGMIPLNSPMRSWICWRSLGLGRVVSPGLVLFLVTLLCSTTFWGFASARPALPVFPFLSFIHKPPTPTCDFENISFWSARLFVMSNLGTKAWLVKCFGFLFSGEDSVLCFLLVDGWSPKLEPWRNSSIPCWINFNVICGF